MKKSKIAYALSATALLVGPGVFGSARTWADGCSTAESLAVAGQVSSEAELRYAITTPDIAEVVVADDFTISCTNSSGDATYITKDFTIDLNGKKITANTPWALDIEGEAANGKTLTIKDSGAGGTFEFNDAGIWVDNGANLTIESGDIRGTGGRGRGIVLQRGGKFILNGGSISGDPVSYMQDNVTYWHNLVQVSGEATSAEINGGTITVGSGEGRAFYSYAANTTMSNGAIYSNGDYAVEVDSADFTMSGGSIFGKTFGFVMFGGTNFAMSGGTVEAGSIAVSGNGTSTSDTITVGGNSIIRSGNLGIYAPQIEGATTITGGNVEAKTGVEVRAGTLNISGGSFLVDGEAVYEISSNGNGSTTTGAAVAVAQHTTKQPIDVNITGGVFIAPVVFSEANPQNNSAEDIAKINLNIAGGVFSGSVVSEDFERESFITGGDFVDMTAATDGTEVVINGAVVSDGVKKLEVSEVEKNTLALFGGGTLVLARDIKLTDKDGEVKVETSDGVNLIVSLAISDEEYAALMDYDKVQVVYFDDESKEANRIDAELKGNSTDGYYVEFTTTHLSTYGVVGVNESEEESEAEAVAETDSPETGTMTSAGASASVAAMAAAVTVGVLTSIVSFAYLMRRKD